MRFATGCLVLCALVAPCASAVSGPSASVALVPEVDWAKFQQPDGVNTPAVLWLWNEALDPAVIKAQLNDMADHGFRSVCMLPMPRAFRPDSTNNHMDPDYLTPEFFGRAALAAGEAAALGMNWWVYDEGGWPSGKALGKVAEGRPDWERQTLVREEAPASGPFTVPADALALVVEKPGVVVYRPGDIWTPRPGESGAWLYRVKNGGYVDLMNPEVTRRFIELTHEPYKNALAGMVGGAVSFTFTDEPNCANLHPPESIPWTTGMDALYLEKHRGNLLPVLPALFTPPGPDMPREHAQARVDYYDLWTGRFRDAYFLQLRDWCRGAGMASGGHLNGEEATENAVVHGFGHALRQLRAMDVPGVDVIWRQLFPGREGQHHFPKYASTAAHQNGTRFAFTEAFCVYGNGVTPAQMKWLTDYQYARGLNLMVAGCYPLSTQDHHMTGERPHFGVSNPLWGPLAGYAAHTGRLGFLMSAGKPKIHTALYYPVRDLWARGAEGAGEAVETHDLLARELLARQCDFDLVDDDILLGPDVFTMAGVAAAGEMFYTTIVCGATDWMDARVYASLRTFAMSGGRVLCLGRVPVFNGTTEEIAAPEFEVFADAAALVENVPQTAELSPPCGGIRAAARRAGSGELLMLFNEGDTPYEGRVAVPKKAAVQLDTLTGARWLLPVTDKTVPVSLAPWESVVIFSADTPPEGVAPRPAPAGEPLVLDASVTATPRRQWVAGEHDFEVRPLSLPGVPFDQAASWKDWLTADFSGEADYTAAVEIPQDWAGCPLRLETGPVEYAATVLVDGKEAGFLLWAPWTVDLPPLSPGRHELTIRVVNTLANELTSRRVTDAWAAKSGPGWPSPYHVRTLAFEQESRGGGLRGPVRLFRLKP